MPDTIRTANGRLRSRPWRGGFLAAFLTVAQCIIDRPAQAAPEYALGSLAADLTSVGHQQVATLTLTLGLLLFSVLAVVVLLRTRRLAGETATLSRDEVGALQCRARPPQGAADGRAASAGLVGRRRRRAGDRRRHRLHRARRHPAARAGIRRLARCERSAANGTRGRNAAGRGPRLRHERHDALRQSGRSRRPRDRRQRHPAPARHQRHRTRSDRPHRPP